MRFLLVTTLLAAAVAAGPAQAGAATFTTPVEPFVVDRGCDYGDMGCTDPSRHHAGVDLLPDESPEAILASADGIVRIAEPEASDDSHEFGNVVVLEHALPDGSHVSTVYGHMRDAPAVRTGDCIRRGQRIGTMGRTGASDDVVHLHFEVKERPTLGPPYGYTSSPPDEEGFFDPKAFVGKREAAELCAPDVTPVDPEVGQHADSDCADGPPSASLPAVARSRGALRASGRVRRLASGCRVQVMLVRRDLREARCAFWRESRRRMEWRACDSPLWTTVAVARDGGVARWNHRFRRRFVGGEYELALRLVDRDGRAHVPPGHPGAAFSLG